MRKKRHRQFLTTVCAYVVAFDDGLRARLLHYEPGTPFRIDGRCSPGILRLVEGRGLRYRVAVARKLAPATAAWCTGPRSSRPSATRRSSSRRPIWGSRPRPAKGTPNQALVRFEVRMIECVATRLRMIAGVTRRSAGEPGCVSARRIRIYPPHLTSGVRNGLSRMKGNFHVRFCGVGSLVTVTPDPTGEAGGSEH